VSKLAALVAVPLYPSSLNAVASVPITSTVCFLKSLGVSANMFPRGSNGYPNTVELQVPAPPFWYPHASVVSFERAPAGSE
jgi:hypothetical protein